MKTIEQKIRALFDDVVKDDAIALTDIKISLIEVAQIGRAKSKYEVEEIKISGKAV